MMWTGLYPSHSSNRPPAGAMGGAVELAVRAQLHLIRKPHIHLAPSVLYKTTYTPHTLCLSHLNAAVVEQLKTHYISFTCASLKGHADNAHLLPLFSLTCRCCGAA